MEAAGMGMVLPAVLPFRSGEADRKCAILLHLVGPDIADLSETLPEDSGTDDSFEQLKTYARMRSRLWGGPLPSLGRVLGGSATLIFEYLRRVGRVDPPVDAATAVAAPAATA
ncbi:hypothetical protein FJT64_013985 [Amphibalanus amphitrite]|uniref:Uncharacterized protein n=1 Tax=Amphibalanus amphitrite TaxID=1232801 RepID=A0A6A4VAF0_AMPAM|nr:hypothetical protein FJT64_013985 [Amphibalanus amphitrite]